MRAPGARHRWENRQVECAGANESKREPNEFQTLSPFLASCFPDSKILSLPWWINERSVLVRTDFTDPSQDTSATNNQIISWTYHSPFSGFSYFPRSRTEITREMPATNAE